MRATEYLSAVKAKLNITSDYRLSKALNVPSSLVARYQAGKSVPGPVVAFRVAEILGEQPAAVVAEFEAERAEKMGKTDELDEWRGILKRIGGGAAGILLALGFTGSPNADAGLPTGAGHSSSYTSSKTRRRKAGPWSGLFRSMAVAF